VGCTGKELFHHAQDLEEIKLFTGTKEGIWTSGG